MGNEKRKEKGRNNTRRCPKKFFLPSPNFPGTRKKKPWVFFSVHISGEGREVLLLLLPHAKEGKWAISPGAWWPLWGNTNCCPKGRMFGSEIPGAQKPEWNPFKDFSLIRCRLCLSDERGNNNDIFVPSVRRMRNEHFSSQNNDWPKKPGAK